MVDYLSIGEPQVTLMDRKPLEAVTNSKKTLFYSTVKKAQTFVSRVHLGVVLEGASIRVDTNYELSTSYEFLH